MGWLFKSKEEQEVEEEVKSKKEYWKKYGEKVRTAERKQADEERRDEEQKVREERERLKSAREYEQARSGGKVAYTTKKAGEAVSKLGGAVGGAVKQAFYKTQEERAAEEAERKRLKKAREDAYKDQLAREQAKIGRAQAKKKHGYEEIYQKAREKEVQRQARLAAKGKYGFESALQKEKIKELRRQAKLQANRDLRGTGGTTKREEDRVVFSQMGGRMAGEQQYQSPVDLLASTDPLAGLMNTGSGGLGQQQPRGQKKPYNPLALDHDVFAGMMGPNRWQMNPLDKANPFYRTHKQRKGGK